jgi:transcriptional regulator with XRE-family HTH domain
MPDKRHEEHMSKNPIATKREQMGLSRHEFAILLGVNYSVLGNVETGRTHLPRSWAEKVREAGLDYPALAAANAEWRQELHLALKSAKGA